MKTAIILPAYNVAHHLPVLLDELLQYKERTILVDDASVDETAEIIKKKGFLCLQNESNQGVSKTIQKGVCCALDLKCDSVIIMDADGQHSPRFIPQFEQALQNNDLVVGNRFYSVQNALSNKLASNMIASLLMKKIFHYDFKDVSCGFKAFHLDKWLYEIIEHSDLYSFIYDVFEMAVVDKKRISSVNIDCIYHYNEFQYTKVAEIFSLLKSLKKYISDELSRQLNINQLYYNLSERKNFSLKIDTYLFWGFYIKEVDGYVVQTPPANLYQFFEK